MASTPELAHCVRGVHSCADRLSEICGHPDLVRSLITLVRAMDAEIVSAVHQSRVDQMKPHYPESFQAEECGYEAVEKLLRNPVPKEEDL